MNTCGKTVCLQLAEAWLVYTKRGTMAGFLTDDEKSVFNRFSSKIIDSINFSVLVPEAFSVALISKRERADCFTKKDHPYDMGDVFVGIMIRKINTSATNFYIFVQLLKSLGEAERDLAREMEAAVGARAEDKIPAATLRQMMNAGKNQITAGSPGLPAPVASMVPPAAAAAAGLVGFAADDKPTLKDLQYMSYTSKDGRTVPFRLMDQVKPQVTRLAAALGFPKHIIDDMETKRDPVFYLLGEWVKGRNQEHDSRPLTWGTLITALGQAGLLEEVKILEEQFVAGVLPVTKRAAVEVRVKRTIQADSPDSDHVAAPTPSAPKYKDYRYVEDVVSPQTKSGSRFDVQSKVNENPHARGFAVIVANGKYQKSESLNFTENDGIAMKETFKKFGFNCYSEKDLTGDKIKDLVAETSRCDYPPSYQYVAFVYSGHGKRIKSKGDQETSGLVGIDEELIETTDEVVNPLKSIKQSIVKMVFLDACRGDAYPVSKGETSNCLVAYATQLGYRAVGYPGKGSQWMIPLAEKLKQRDKSVQEVLKQVKEELLKKKHVQYPETDDSDCSQPIYLDREPVQSKGAPAAVPRVGDKPNIGDLASFVRRNDEGFISIIDQIIEAENTVIEYLNRRLRVNADWPAQQEPASDEHKIRFVLEVLNKWLSKEEPKVQPTWENLTECLEEAGLNEDAVKEIKDNLKLD